MHVGQSPKTYFFFPKQKIGMQVQTYQFTSYLVEWRQLPNYIFVASHKG